MIEVAKLDSNNKIENTFNINKNYGVDATGVISQAKVEQYCIKTFGAGTYIANTDEIAGQANKGSNYSAELNCFYADRYDDMNGNPCASWALNGDTGEWDPPHMYEEIIGEDTYTSFKWSESINRWYAKKRGEMTTWYKWNPATSAWEDQTDI